MVFPGLFVIFAQTTSPMKRILVSLALSCLALTAVAQEPYSAEVLHKQAPVVPVYMVFAGDTIRFDRPDFKERMDRELISYTYMHTNTTLILKRSRRYFDQVGPILRKYGIPDDLKYLMAIESNLDPKALSTAGAAGLWQFTKSTATQYGLEVSGEVDERYHIEKETVAACKFLKDALAKFGNWMTVAASYNAGQAGIRKRLDDQRQTTALELWLPEETSRYMFRLLAMKMFFERHRFRSHRKPGGFRRIQRNDLCPPERSQSLAPFRQAYQQEQEDLRDLDSLRCRLFLLPGQVPGEPHDGAQDGEED